jgi:hypothetical protein
MALRKIKSNADKQFENYAEFYDERPALKQRILGVHLPKSYLILSAMLKNIERGGLGTVSLNIQGGFAYDAAVRKMIEKGFVTMGRQLIKAGHEYDGWSQSPVSITTLTITDKGKAEYARLKKRLG